jgi:hypothetical protein
VTKEEEGVDMALQVSPLSQDDDRLVVFCDPTLYNGASDGCRTLDRPVNLQLMLDECLGDEDVEYKCELCPGRSSVVTHRFARLPRCVRSLCQMFARVALQKFDRVCEAVRVSLGHGAWKEDRRRH